MFNETTTSQFILGFNELRQRTLLTDQNFQVLSVSPLQDDPSRVEVELQIDLYPELPMDEQPTTGQRYHLETYEVTRKNIFDYLRAIPAGLFLDVHNNGRGVQDMVDAIAAIYRIQFEVADFIDAPVVNGPVDLTVNPDSLLWFGTTRFNVRLIPPFTL